jgi:hypothetical protein
VDLLSELLRTHSATELLDKLQGLAGFLQLPGPITSYLPPTDLITLGNLGDLDLRYAAAAGAVVKCIMSHSATSSSIRGTVRKGAAYFFIRDLSKRHDSFDMESDSDADSDTESESESDSVSDLGTSLAAAERRMAQRWQQQCTC